MSFFAHADSGVFIKPRVQQVAHPTDLWSRLSCILDLLTCKRLKYLSDLGAVVWIDGPFPGKVFDVGSAAAADLSESRIDEATLRRFSAGVRLEVLDMRSDAGLYAIEGMSRGTVSSGSESAEIILSAMDVAAKAQVIRFEAHLTERHVVIDAFDRRLLNVMPRDGKGLAYVGLRIFV